ncbi:nitroreductase [Stappia sp. F7233]|uniref:Putative NAD(P)H nitroreductase n=2 Tax=Stappia albiluteola TaxID=2758565 RepID=A0A839AEN1_9HYPH|nr:nitroreductase [Stappia albiluteola]
MVEPAPDDAELMQLLTAAARIPDHGKLAPWRFIVFRGEARLEAGRRLLAIAERKNGTLDEGQRKQELERLARAPLVVAVVSRAAEHPKIPVWEQQLSAGACCMTLLHAAHALGYAAQWLTEWVAYDAEAGRILGVKDGEQIAGFIHIGTPSLPPTERPRPELDQIVTYWQGE